MLPDSQLVNLDDFESAWSELKAEMRSGFFEFTQTDASFRSAVTLHFRSLERGDRWGIYVIRQLTTGDVIYIGKAGTVKNNGSFRKQNIPARLKAERGKKIPSDVWFEKLRTECGNLRIEYLFFAPTPKSPALAESMLLQAFLNDNGRLPRYNESF